MLRDLGRDFRYASRTLLRAPTFGATVIVTLSIGIGANSVIFSAVDAVLWHDAPVADPDSLVEVYTTSGSNLHSSSSYPDYFDLRDSKTFASLAAYTALSMTLDVNGEPERLAGQLVSGNYFDVLGIAMPFGRGFAADDDRLGAPVRVAVVSHALWRRAFNADPASVGRAIRLNGNPYTLIGVAPPRFVGPILGVAPDIWVPSALQPEVDPPAASVRRARGHSAIFDLRRSRGLNLVGRLPSGVSIDQARVRADVVASRLQTAYPESNRNRRFTVVPLGEGRGLRVAARPLLQLLAAAVLTVLLVACVNVASLLLARAASREREIAVRIAVGAGRWRLVRQWLAESVLLGTLGSIGALLIVRVGTPLLHPFVVPDAVDVTMNPRVLTFTLVVGIASGLLFGLAPVWQILRRSTASALRTYGTAATGYRSASARGALVVFQVALTLVLVVAAGLFVRTLVHAYSVDVGYQVDGIVVLPLNLEPHGYFEGGSRGPDAGLTIYEQILSRVEALPGVVAASAARMTVLSGGARSTAVSRDGRPIDRDAGNALGVRANVVSHRYFETLNIPILRGRGFDASDTRHSTRVAIVTRLLADRLWPGEDPIGKPLRDENIELRVVGVVPDTVYTSTLERDRSPTYYLLLAQNYESSVALHVRTASSAMSLGRSIVEEVRQVDPQLAADRPQPLGDILDRTLGRQRMMATLVGLFGAIALLLAGVGLYGLMAYFATERTPEIGIRLAMGAHPSSILSLLMRQGLWLLAIGLAIGVTGALLGTWYIQAQLFGVTATDPLTFVAACAVLILAGVIACAIPSLRAMHVDPIAVLRS
jgi:macrolide transport system ATP-binding/permease protein